jgi:hypothetical protein
MGFGKLTPTQRQAIQVHVSGKTVHDVGAGDLELSKELLALGARRVVAIDKEEMPSPPKGIITVKSYFYDFTEPVQTAFISWPVNWAVLGLKPILERAPTVIYLGSNVDGRMCGIQKMWEQFSIREVLEYVPDPANTLIIYGSTRRKRSLFPEEYAALNLEKIWTFQELHNSDARLLGSTLSRT